MTENKVKTQIEMKEEMNRKMIIQEENKWDRDQLHMESQILNTIQLARQKQKIIEKDAQRMEDYEKQMKKNNDARLKRCAEYNKRRQEILDKAKKERMRPINQEIRKTKKKLKDYVTEAKRISEEFQSLDRMDLLKKEELSRQKLSLLENWNKSPEEKQKESQIGDDIPEYIKQKKKYDEFWGTTHGADSENARQLDYKIMELEEENRRRDEIIAREREKRHRHMTEVLSNIEENQKKAAEKQKAKVKEAVHQFVDKQIKTAAKKEKLLKEKIEKLEKNRKEFEEHVKQTAEHKRERDRERDQRARESMEKWAQTENMLKLKRRQQLREINEKAYKTDLHIQKVLEDHEQILIEEREEHDELLMSIQQRADAIKEKKNIEQQMVEERKMHLMELEKEKDQFKKVFSQFQGNDRAQKAALRKLKNQGLKSEKLKQTILEIEREEEEKRKAKNKKPEDEDMM